MCSFQAEGNEISFPQAIQWKRGSYGASGGGMCLSTEERLFLAYLITKLKNTNLNFTVLMAYRTLRITWFHEFRQKLFTLETWIWLLRPKEMLYCKHLFLLHSCPCESTQSVVVRKILFPVTVACQECQGLLPCLFWAEVHTNTHTPNPACFQGLLKLYQLMKHIRCQILRFLFFFTASYQFFVETWRKKNSLLSGRFEVSMWKHQVPAEQGFHMLDLWARHNQANGKTCEVISECSLVCPWVLGCVLALTSAFIHSVMDSCQSSSQWASLMSCFVPKACLYCVFRGNTPGRLCSG